MASGKEDSHRDTRPKELNRSSEPECVTGDLNTGEDTSKHASMSTKNLCRIAAELEAELEAFHFVFSSLKKEKSRQHKVLLKYGQLSVKDPYAALHRDTEMSIDDSHDGAASSGSTSNSAICQDSCLQQAMLVTHQPLVFVEDLVKTHKRNLHRLGIQILQLEQRYQKALNDLEDEKKKHAQDQAVGDDVTYHLEKEREKLVQQIESERESHKKLETEYAKLKQLLANERSRRQHDTVKLLKDRQSLVYRLYNEKKQAQATKEKLESETSAMTQLSKSLEQITQKCETLEQENKNRTSKSEYEKEQLEMKLNRSEKQCYNLQEEIARLKERIYELERGKTSPSDIPEIVESRQPLSQPLAPQQRREYGQQSGASGAIVRLSPTSGHPASSGVNRAAGLSGVNVQSASSRLQTPPSSTAAAAGSSSSQFSHKRSSSTGRHLDGSGVNNIPDAQLDQYINGGTSPLDFESDRSKHNPAARLPVSGSPTDFNPHVYPHNLNNISSPGAISPNPSMQQLYSKPYSNHMAPSGNLPRYRPSGAKLAGPKPEPPARTSSSLSRQAAAAEQALTASGYPQ